VRRPISLAALVSAFVVASLTPSPSRADPTSSAKLLVAQGRERFTAGDDLTAMTRFFEAIEMDPSNVDGYLGLADVRLKRGELSEAESLDSLAISRAPTAAKAWLARGRVRRRLDRRDAASVDLGVALAESIEPTPLRAEILRDVASLERALGRPASELGAWRMLRATAEALGDEATAKEASIQSRALGLYLGDLDPARRREAGDFVRGSIAVVARRRG
jgi:tetratricopeptide (TPR) repeat protein